MILTFDEVQNIEQAHDVIVKKYEYLGTVLAFIIGCHLGAWHNDLIKSSLNIPSKVWTKLIRDSIKSTIESSCDIVDNFFFINFIYIFLHA